MSAWKRYELQAYVCGAGCVKPSPFASWATFEQIFNNRPSGCRFAIVRQVPVRNHQGRIVLAADPEGPYLVWDLYDESIAIYSLQGIDIRTPPPRWTGYSRDGMIMKALMLYDQE